MGIDSERAPFVFADMTATIIAVFFEVFRELGHGFGEHVYRRAMAVALGERGVAVYEEVPIRVHFHGVLVGSFEADLVVQGAVLVEVKAAAALEPYAQAQILNYLKAAGGGVGLLLNFGRTPQFKRMVMGDPAASLPNLARASRR